MPTYKVTDPKSGKTLRLTGDSPPTEEELNQIFSSQSQEQTSQSTQQNIPSNIQPQNILGQLFNVPGAAIRSAMQGKGYAQGAAQPDQVPKFQDMAIKAVQKSTSPIVNATIGMPASALGLALDTVTNPADLLSMLISGGVAKTPIAQAEITLKNEKIAGRVINSLIKPAHKDFLFGNNPGLGVAKEGITANGLEELATKVESRITLLNDASKAIRNTPENIQKTVNLSKVNRPLINSLIELKKAPGTHAPQIKSIETALSDIGRLNKGNLDNLSISDAYKIKKVISGMQDWTIESGAGKAVNKGLRDVYVNIDKTIDKAVPELESINSRMSNLISAKQAILHRVEILSKQEPMPTVMKVIDLPFAAMKTPTAKTMLGKLLAKQFKVPK